MKKRRGVRKQGASTLTVSQPGIPIGAAILSTNPVPMPSALDLPKAWNFQDSVSVQASVQLLTAHDQLTQHLEANAGIDFSISGVGIGVNGDYSRTVRIDNYTLSVLVSILVLTGSQTFKDDFQISSRAKKIYGSDPKAFAAEYGDLFCAEEVYGGYLTGIGTYTAYSQEETLEISASISAAGLSFGGWGSAQQVISTLRQKENFSFDFFSEGPTQFQLGNGNVLKNPQAFFKACNDWITASLKSKPGNAVDPIRQYFLTYHSAGLLKAPLVDWQFYSHLLEMQNEANDTMNRIADILRDTESKYEGVVSPDVQAAQAKVKKYLDDLNGYLTLFRADPFNYSGTPPQDFTPPALPPFNKHSKASIFHHFSNNGYAEIAMT